MNLANTKTTSLISKSRALILLGALCWAVSFLHVRAHAWVSTPFQLVFWEVLLATVVLTALAYMLEGMPSVTWTTPLLLAVLYASVLGTALGYWAMAMVNRSLPAMTTSLGLLATPVVGTAGASIMLGEPITLTLISAMALIIGGIAIGTLVEAKPR